MTEKEIREHLRNAKSNGKIENYRILQNGEIHVYGTMPNTNQTGYYYVGKVNDNDIGQQLEYYA
jgi:hypothetical protein